MAPQKKKPTKPSAKPKASGTATPAQVEEKKPAEPKGPPVVVGISLGDSYASIAVINKEKQPECIANEDGERQIACAVSFSGSEVYIGNQARPQLVKNSQNTITNFRNLLGKKFSSVTPPQNVTSAPVVQSPDDIPAYTISYSPSGANGSAFPGSGTATPKLAIKKDKAARSIKSTPLDTPRPESPTENLVQKTITVPEVTAMLLKSLHQSAFDFLGKEIDGTVVSVPAWFTAEQKDALAAAAKDAGVKLVGTVDEAAAVVLAYDERRKASSATNNVDVDRIVLVVDLGASSLTLTVLSVKDGLIHTLASLYDTTLGGNAIDTLLINHFAKEFTKKTKIPLSFPSSDPQDRRAEAKLRLAVEHTKRTLSASPGAAACSVESLKDGYDFSGSITRMRFDLLISSIYKGVAEKVREVLKQAGVDIVHVDEVLLAGASAVFPGLKDELQASVIGADEDDEDDEEAQQPKTSNTKKTTIFSTIEPYEVVSLGAVLQAQLLTSLSSADQPAFTVDSGVSRVLTTAKPIGMVFHQEDGSKPFIPLVYAHTPLPVRRIVRFDVDASKVKKVGFEVWEGEDTVELWKGGELVEGDAAAKEAKDEEDEEDEEAVTRTRKVRETTKLGALQLDLESGKKTKALVKTIVQVDGSVEITLSEEGVSGKEQVLKLPPPSVVAWIYWRYTIGQSLNCKWSELQHATLKIFDDTPTTAALNAHLQQGWNVQHSHDLAFV
ncbi:Hsp70 protein that interacts with Zuo1p [Tulasnella sp. 403]|nr:Hsp70 protein that interacts with Zuo1p [Tulasnella sp. 403]